MRGSKVDLKICVILWNKIKHFGGHWVNPSQITLGRWLCNQGNLDVSRRTLNRYLRTMQGSIQLLRIRRVKHDPVKGYVFQTTLYALGYLGLLLLCRNGVITYAELREYQKNSKPFRARLPKKEKKGVAPSDPGYYKDFTFSGGPVQRLV